MPDVTIYPNQDDILASAVTGAMTLEGSPQVAPSTADVSLPSRDQLTLPMLAGGGNGPPTGANSEHLKLTLDDYEIERELGHGGMGVVFKARHKRLNRIVAIKMILATQNDSETAARFRCEAEIIARIDHPNIIAIYEIGESQGRPYFSLEYCPHGSLDKRLSNGANLEPRHAAKMVEQIARAVHAAHEAGIVHRDLKPGNILLTADDTAKVTDFGIAKHLDGANSHTQTGIIIGTPSYMSPEQAGGHNSEVGPPSDIYSLGAILYECVTGRAPFVAATPLETILQVTGQEPLPPRLLNRKIDMDLEKIILRCLEKRPEKRYATAEKLANDLRCYMAGEPIQARSVNLLERLQREIALSQHDEALRPWGHALIWLGSIIFVAHLITSIFLSFSLSESLAFWLPRSIMIIAGVVILKRTHSTHSLLPSNSVERTIWAVWVGYLLAFGSLFWSMHLMGHGHLQIYGPTMALAGLAWFAMGGYVWGGCYVLALMFFIAGPLLAALPDSVWSPFRFGACWGVAMIVMGGHYRRRKRG